MRNPASFPRNCSPDRKYPILVALHGGGEKGNDNAIQVDREDLGSTRLTDSVQTRWPHFVLVPRCPTNLSWGGAANEGIFQILDSLKREFALDTNRFYAAGLSMRARRLRIRGLGARRVPGSGTGNGAAQPLLLTRP